MNQNICYYRSIFDFRWYVEGKESPSYKEHVSRIADFLWLGVDGMKMTGTNGSQLWDTALTVQAYIDAGAHNIPHLQGCLENAYTFLDTTQVTHES